MVTAGNDDGWIKVRAFLFKVDGKDFLYFCNIFFKVIFFGWLENMCANINSTLFLYRFFFC